MYATEVEEASRVTLPLYSLRNCDTQPSAPLVESGSAGTFIVMSKQIASTFSP